jgi:NADPH-dependent 2,4-dienoyl-CoA reductase/sulfur reductase-like enzyme
MPLRPDEFYQIERITVKKAIKVLSLDPKRKELTLSSKETLKFDKCLLATGSRPAQPRIKGIDSPKVHYLRSFEDCMKLKHAIGGKKRVVVVGGGFIGMETAAAMREAGAEVTVAFPHAVPLQHVVGPELGAYLKALHESHGIKFQTERQVVEISAMGVVYDNGVSERADVVLVAVGIIPNQEIAKAAGLRCGNGIEVNSYLETSVPSVFAAGDVASWPYPQTGERLRSEHWVAAQRQGQTAAMNMLGEKIPYRDVPFFWSHQFDFAFNYVGHAKKWTRTELKGSLAHRNFVQGYFEGEKLVAVATVGRDLQNLQVEACFEKDDGDRVAELFDSFSG